jgi:hypothetical protein
LRINPDVAKERKMIVLPHPYPPPSEGEGEGGGDFTFDDIQDHL